MRWDDELDERRENERQCSVCERVVEEEPSLPKCSACGKRFCEFCVFRVGGKEYCSRTCGVRYFFATDETEEGDEE